MMLDVSIVPRGLEQQVQGIMAAVHFLLLQEGRGGVCSILLFLFISRTAGGRVV
jgi:hypothetical protein